MSFKLFLQNFASISFGKDNPLAAKQRCSLFAGNGFFQISELDFYK